MEAPLLIGSVLDGKYSIEKLIGEGGMGAVYRALHVGTGRPVAVKVLLSSLGRSSEAIARFRREARAAGGLRHPNIVDVTDFGIATVGGADVAYLVMEYLEGSTLRDLAEQKASVPLDVAVEIIEQIASAVQAAHRAGIVHRDLKPDNVWLVNDARGGFVVRVLDFGIARLTGEVNPSEQFPVNPAFDSSARAESAEVDTMILAPDVFASVEAPYEEATAVKSPAWTPSGATTDRLTVAGSTLGTPLYMSPEQCLGREADERSDIYSLGVIAYEIIEGRRPFEGRFRELIHQHAHVPPPALRKAPPRAGAVITRALSKRPDERYRTAQAFAGSLRVATEGAGTILRRSVALYSERLGEFLHLSWRATSPQVTIALLLIGSAAVAGLAAGPRYFARGMIIATAAAPVLWGMATIMTNAMFAAAVERLRLRPLETLSAREVSIDLRRRIGLPPTAGYLTTLWRLTAFYLGGELRSQAGAGDLAFLIRFIEGLPLAEVPPRCSTLAGASSRAYTLVRAALIGALVLMPVIEAAVIAFALEPLVAHSRILAMLAGMALMPINAMLVNPIFSSSLALLYFRSRQANGEDVPLAAILPGRV